MTRRKLIIIGTEKGGETHIEGTENILNTNIGQIIKEVMPVHGA